jgi:ankyrin repeat protein
MLGHLPDVERLLREGASVSTTDATNGWSALHYAAASGRKEVVLKLVQVGANIDAATAQGESAMELASGHPSVEALLKSLGAADSVKRDIV